MTNPKLAVIENELPDELKAQLSRQFLRGTQTIDEFQANILPIFNDLKEATLDDLLVAYWKEHQIILKRNNLTAKLHKLTRLGILEHNGRKYKVPDVQE